MAYTKIRNIKTTINKAIEYITNSSKTNDGKFVYGYCTAEDTGGAITGNIVDLYYDTMDECYAFGRRNVNIYILN